MTVDRRPAKAERRHQKRKARDGAERHVKLGDPLLEGGEIGGRDGCLDWIRIVSAFGKTIRPHSSSASRSRHLLLVLAGGHRLGETAESETFLLRFFLAGFGLRLLFLATREPG